MPKVTITNDKGLVQSRGRGFELEHSPKLRTSQINGGTTGSCTAFTILSGTGDGGQNTGTGAMARLPAVASATGQEFYFRAGGSRKSGGGVAQKGKSGCNVISGSTSDAILDLFYWASGSQSAPGGVLAGQRIQLGNSEGDCLKVVSDGRRYFCYSLTGSHRIATGGPGPQ